VGIITQHEIGDRTMIGWSKQRYAKFHRACWAFVERWISRIEILSPTKSAVILGSYQALITAPATWPLSGLSCGSPWWTQRRWR